MLVPAGVCASRVGGKGWKWHPSGFLFLRKSPKDPCHSSMCSEFRNKTVSCILQAVLKLLFVCCISLGCFLYCLFKGRDSVSYFPLAPQGLGVCWFLKFQVLTPADVKSLQNYVTLVVKDKYYGYSSSLCGFLVPGEPTVKVCVFPHYDPTASSCGQSYGSILFPTASLPFLASWMWPLLSI